LVEEEGVVAAAAATATLPPLGGPDVMAFGFGATEKRSSSSSAPNREVPNKPLLAKGGGLGAEEEPRAVPFEVVFPNRPEAAAPKRSPSSSSSTAATRAVVAAAAADAVEEEEEEELMVAGACATTGVSAALMACPGAGSSPTAATGALL